MKNKKSASSGFSFVFCTNFSLCKQRASALSFVLAMSIFSFAVSVPDAAAITWPQAPTGEEQGGKIGSAIYPEFNTITNTAKVGIGTDAPEDTLHVVGGGVFEQPVWMKNFGLEKYAADGSSKFLTTKEYVDAQIAAFSSDSIFDADGNTSVQTEESANENKIRFDTDGTERMVINENGNIGIGTTSPGEELEVSGNIKNSGTYTSTKASGLIATYGDDSYNTKYIQWRAGIAGIQTGLHSSIDATGALVFKAGLSKGVGFAVNKSVDFPSLVDTDMAMFINKDGNVGIGTTTPATKLHVQGNARITGALYDANNSPGTNGYILTTTGTTTAWADPSTALSGTLGINDLTDAQKDSTNNNLFLGGAGFSGTFYNNDNTAIGRGAFDHPNTDATQSHYGDYNTAVGRDALTNNTTGYYNSAQGVSALYSNTTGSHNAAQGVNALFSNTTGYYNSAQGVSALYSNTTGSNNAAQGVNALHHNTTGSNNAAQGVSALHSNTTGHHNAAQGVNALYSNTTGYYNSAQGVNALYYNTTGSNNAAQGAYTLYSNTTGSNNSAQGHAALSRNTTGYSNSAQGYAALNRNTTGHHNSAQGVNALYYNTTGYYNSAQGVNALYSNTTGYYNAAQGVNAGHYIADGSTGNTTGNSSIFLGSNTKAHADGETNQIVIGANATGNGSNSATLGNDAITKTILKGNVGIGTTSPGVKLGVAGDIKITSGQKDGIWFGNVSNASTPVYRTGGTGITGGSDSAGLGKLNNIAVQTWYGFSVSPTISGQTVAQGTPAFSINARTGQMWSSGPSYLAVNTGNVGIGTTAPETKLDVAGAITQEPLSADPADPSDGNSVQWVSDGTGLGDAGDVMMKINVGGTIKVITLVDFSEIS